MNLASVQKQLLRDIKRSPLKSGVLGLLCLVALYFWAPLVAGWFGGEKPIATKAVTQPSPVAEIPQQVQPNPSNVPLAGVAWQGLMQGIGSDPRMQSATFPKLTIDPFASAKTQVDSNEDKPAPSIVAAEPQLDISQFGLRLSSTMLGRRRVAIINGRPYAEGSQVEAKNDLLLTVARVADRSVLLEHDGHQFELTMVKPQ